jgi:hypothetical protein
MPEVIRDFVVMLRYETKKAEAKQALDEIEKLRHTAAGLSDAHKKARDEWQKNYNAMAKASEDAGGRIVKGIASNISRPIHLMGEGIQRVANIFINKFTAMGSAVAGFASAIVGIRSFQNFTNDLAKLGDFSRQWRVAAGDVRALGAAFESVTGSQQGAFELTRLVASQINSTNRAYIAMFGVTSQEIGKATFQLIKGIKEFYKQAGLQQTIYMASVAGISEEMVRQILDLDLELSEEQRKRDNEYRAASERALADAKRYRDEWNRLGNEINGIKNTIFVPVMEAISNVIASVNRNVIGPHRTEIAEFFAAIMKPLEGWSEDKANQIVRYMNLLISSEGQPERDAWVTWWKEINTTVSRVAEAVNNIVAGIKVVHGFGVWLNKPIGEVFRTKQEQEQFEKDEEKRRKGQLPPLPRAQRGLLDDSSPGPTFLSKEEHENELRRRVRQGAYGKGLNEEEELRKIRGNNWIQDLSKWLNKPISEVIGGGGLGIISSAQAAEGQGYNPYMTGSPVPGTTMDEQAALIENQRREEERRSEQSKLEILEKAKRAKRFSQGSETGSPVPGTTDDMQNELIENQKREEKRRIEQAKRDALERARKAKDFSDDQRAQADADALVAFNSGGDRITTTASVNIKENTDITRTETQATKENTEEVRKNTQELRESRIKRSLKEHMQDAWGALKNALGMGGPDTAPGGTGMAGGVGGPGGGAGGAGGTGGAPDGIAGGMGGIGPAGRGKGGLPSGPSGGRVPTGPEIEAKNIQSGMNISRPQWNAFIRGVVGIESGGRYNIMGGSAKRVPGGRFAGRYQMGGQEIIGAAKALGETPPIRYVNGVAIGNQEFLNNKGMQDRYFEQYTLQHHKDLMRLSSQYRGMNPEKQLQVLGYAHNQGVGGAVNFLNTGRAGKDAFGTSGTRYMAPIARELANLSGNQQGTGSRIAAAAAKQVQGGQGGLQSKGADPRIAEIVGAGAGSLPPGYTVRTTEHGGLRPNQKYGFHPKGMANDFQIFTPDGKAIPNRGDDPTGMYTRLARASYAYQLKNHPDLTGKFAWGGAFGTVPGGKVQDLMHFDIGGERGRILKNRLSNLGPLEDVKGAIQAADNQNKQRIQPTDNQNKQPIHPTQPSQALPNIDALRSLATRVPPTGSPIAGGDNPSPLASPAPSNDNSRNIEQTNQFNTTIHANDPRAAASVFKSKAEELNSISMGQLRGVMR